MLVLGRVTPPKKEPTNLIRPLFVAMLLEKLESPTKATRKF